MEEIGNILPNVFRRHVRREDPRVTEILASLWPRIAGKLVAEHSRPVAFASGTLTLAVNSGCWAKELQHLTEEIRARVNACMGGPVVKKLRVSCASKSELRAWKFEARNQEAQPLDETLIRRLTASASRRA